MNTGISINNDSSSIQLLPRWPPWSENKTNYRGFIPWIRESTLFYCRESDCTTLDKTKGITLSTALCDIVEEPQEKEISREKKTSVRRETSIPSKPTLARIPQARLPCKITEGPILPSTASEGPQLAGWAPEFWQFKQPTRFLRKSKAPHSLAPRPKGGVLSKHLEAETRLLAQRVVRASTPPQLGTPADEPKDQEETWTLKTTAFAGLRRRATAPASSATLVQPSPHLCALPGMRGPSPASAAALTPYLTWNHRCGHQTGSRSADGRFRQLLPAQAQSLTCGRGGPDLIGMLCACAVCTCGVQRLWCQGDDVRRRSNLPEGSGRTARLAVLRRTGGSGGYSVVTNTYPVGLSSRSYLQTVDPREWISSRSKTAKHFVHWLVIGTLSLCLSWGCSWQVTTSRVLLPMCKEWYQRSFPWLRNRPGGKRVSSFPKRLLFHLGEKICFCKIV